MRQLFTCNRIKVVHFRDIIRFENERWVLSPDATLIDIFPCQSVTYDSSQSNTNAGKVEKRSVEVSISRDKLPLALESPLSRYVAEISDGAGGYVYIGNKDYPAQLTVSSDKFYSTIQIESNIPII